MSQNAKLKPIYLLADSRPLFWVDNGTPFLSGIRDQVDSETPRAAYIGASNRDRPEFYSIFQAAMEQVAITNCNMIPSALSAEDRSCLLAADIVLLSGGDVALGWTAMQENGLGESIIASFNSGAVLIGVSAGAVQLGQVGWSQGDGSPTDVFPTLGLVPYVISAHQEDQDWEDLKKLVQFLGEGTRGIGIPTGGAAIYHPDHTLQPLRHPLHEFQAKDSEIASSILIPGDQRRE